MFLTERDRELLAEALRGAIPNMEHKELRQVFTLMAAILSDFQELRAARDEERQNHLQRLRKIEGDLRVRAENRVDGGERDKKIWH